jgi:uncharacterized Zn-finger protein
MPATGRNTVLFQPTSNHTSVLMTLSLQTPVYCPVCHKAISRKADLPRHMRTHDENKEALCVAVPYYTR